MRLKRICVVIKIMANDPYVVEKSLGQQSTTGSTIILECLRISARYQYQFLPAPVFSEESIVEAPVLGSSLGVSWREVVICSLAAELF